MDNQDDSSQTSQSGSKVAFLRTKKFSVKSIIIVIASIVVLIIALLVYHVWYQNPNKVVSDGLLNAVMARSVAYDGSITLAGNDNMDIAITGLGNKDGGTLNAKLTITNQNDTYNIEGYSLIDKTGDVYFKVKNIDTIVQNYRATVPESSRATFDRVIASINDTWVRISAEQLQEYSADLSQARECITEAMGKIQQDTNTKSEIAAIYKQHPFIKIDELLGSKDGSFGYALTTDPDKTKSFAGDLRQTELYKSLQLCDASFTINDDGSIGTDDASSTGDQKVEVWVSRWSHQITKVSLDSNATSGIDTIVVKPDFNKQVTVTVPEQATTLEQLQSDLRSLLLTPTSQP